MKPRRPTDNPQRAPRRQRPDTRKRLALVAVVLGVAGLGLVARAVDLAGATGGALFLWDETEGCLVMRKAVNVTDPLPSRIGSG